MLFLLLDEVSLLSFEFGSLLVSLLSELSLLDFDLSESESESESSSKCCWVLDVDTGCLPLEVEVVSRTELLVFLSFMTKLSERFRTTCRITSMLETTHHGEIRGNPWNGLPSGMPSWAY